MTRLGDNSGSVLTFPGFKYRHIKLRVKRILTNFKIYISSTNKNYSIKKFELYYKLSHSWTIFFRNMQKKRESALETSLH